MKFLLKCRDDKPLENILMGNDMAPGRQYMNCQHTLIFKAFIKIFRDLGKIYSSKKRVTLQGY